MKTGFKWITSPITMMQNLANRLLFGVQKTAQEVLENHKDDIENWMKANAAWQDRTGNARAGLLVDFTQAADTMTLIFQHSVYYGEYLEYDFGGKYSILQPAIDFWFPVLMREIQSELNTMKKVVDNV